MNVKKRYRTFSGVYKLPEILGFPSPVFWKILPVGVVVVIVSVLLSTTLTSIIPIVIGLIVTLIIAMYIRMLCSRYGVHFIEKLQSYWFDQNFVFVRKNRLMSNILKRNNESKV